MADNGTAKQSKDYEGTYIKRKRNPSKLKKSKNSILLHRKSNFNAQFEKCQKLLHKGETEIVLHALGAAVNRAVNIALKLQNESEGLIKLNVNTSTVELIDDLEPLLDDLEPQSQSRNCSAIHIEIRKTTSEDIIDTKIKEEIPN